MLNNINIKHNQKKQDYIRKNNKEKRIRHIKVYLKILKNQFNKGLYMQMKINQKNYRKKNKNRIQNKMMNQNDFN